MAATNQLAPLDSTPPAVATTQPPLTPNVDSLTVLRWPNKLVIQDVAIGGRARGWRERSPTEWEQWLRRAAKDGDFHAMECLGLELFNGNRLNRSPTEGLDWLEKSANLGNPIAMTLLAECLLETSPSAEQSIDAERWLEKSIEQGHTQAAIILGTRLILGAGVSPRANRGKYLLFDAARAGSQLAHIKLGVHLLSGLGLNQDREEGLHWLRCIGAFEANHMSLLAYHVYMKSITAATKGGARILAEEAAVLFQEAARRGNQEEEINLAYLLRRDEISKSAFPSIEILLVSYVNHEKPFALINQALRVAKGVDCTANWEVADILVSKIRNADSILSWWFARSEEGDAEGHLVVGWLARHRLTVDPERIPLPERMNIARDGGWLVPEWMDLLADAH